MTQPFDIANDHTFRTMLGAGLPPLPARITAVSGNEYTLDSLAGDGVALTAVALNGWRYDVDDVVYVLLAANSADNGIIIGIVSNLYQKLAVGDYVVPTGIMTVRGDYARYHFADARITTSETTILAAGNVGSVVCGTVLLDDGANHAADTLDLAVPGSGYNHQDVTLGAATIQFRLYADGSLTAISGSSTASLAATLLSTD